MIVICSFLGRRNVRTQKGAWNPVLCPVTLNKPAGGRKGARSLGVHSRRVPHGPSHWVVLFYNNYRRFPHAWVGGQSPPLGGVGGPASLHSTPETHRCLSPQPGLQLSPLGPSVCPAMPGSLQWASRTPGPWSRPFQPPRPHPLDIPLTARFSSCGTCSIPKIASWVNFK